MTIQSEYAVCQNINTKMTIAMIASHQLLHILLTSLYITQKKSELINLLLYYFFKREANALASLFIAETASATAFLIVPELT